MEASPPNPNQQNHSSPTERFARAGRALGDAIIEEVQGQRELAGKTYAGIGAFATRRMIAWTERSIDRTYSREESAQSDQEFYEDMAEAVDDELKADRDSAPSPRRDTIIPERVSGHKSPFANRVSAQKKKRARMQAAIKGEVIPPAPEPKLKEAESIFDYSDMSRRQRREARRVARNLYTLKDRRATQVSARKMMGHSGKVSRIKTFFYRRELKQETREQLARGEIGYGEAYERGRTRKADAITVTPKFIKRNERTIDRVSTSVPARLSRKVDKAIKTQEKAAKKRDKLEKRREKLEDKEFEFRERQAA